ncbi:MAG: hypothetical protein HFJ04_05280 [Lachnospiraceae bacterium]|nr:hypothetical protein [Lachnospiraceae bacterium]
MAGKRKMSEILVFLALLVMAVSGCSGTQSGETGKKAVNAGSKEPEQEEGGTEQSADGNEEADGHTDDSQEAADASKDAQVKEQTLVDQDGIKITLMSLETGFLGPELKLLIENGTDQGLTVQTRDSSVNGIMTETLFSCDVAAGKSANDGITFMNSELEKAQISVLQNFELSFHIFNSKTWDTVLDTDTVMISTSLDGSEEQALDDSGVLLLDQDGVRLTVKEADSESSFWGADIYIYVENNTEKNITVQASGVSINGFMVEPYFSCDVASGKKSYDSITFLESELEENHIQSIDNMELSFRVFESNSFDTIFETEPLKVEFEKTEE